MCDCQSPAAIEDKPAPADEKTGCGCGPSCGCSTAPDAKDREEQSAAAQA